jgi:PP-loop superfamily ATP-utilizing enzyme
VAELADPARAGQVADRLEAVGFRYVSLDLRGYRAGSMNDVSAEEPR